MDNDSSSIKQRVEVQVGALKTLAHVMETGAERLIHETEAQAVRDWAASLRSISDALTRAVNQEPEKVRFWNRAGVRIASGVLGAASLGLVGGIGEGLAEGVLSSDAQAAAQVVVDGAAEIDALCLSIDGFGDGPGDGDGAYGESDGFGDGRGDGDGAYGESDGFGDGRGDGEGSGSGRGIGAGAGRGDGTGIGSASGAIGDERPEPANVPVVEARTRILTVLANGTGETSSEELRQDARLNQRQFGQTMEALYEEGLIDGIDTSSLSGFSLLEPRITGPGLREL